MLTTFTLLVVTGGALRLALGCGACTDDTSWT